MLANCFHRIALRRAIGALACVAGIAACVGGGSSGTPPPATAYDMASSYIRC
jgi:hypothetical protein